MLLKPNYTGLLLSNYTMYVLYGAKIYSQTKWSGPLKITLMDWLFQESVEPAGRFKNTIMN